MKLTIDYLEEERFFGGTVIDGIFMPYSAGFSRDLRVCTQEIRRPRFYCRTEEERFIRKNLLDMNSFPTIWKSKGTISLWNATATR